MLGGMSLQPVPTLAKPAAPFMAAGTAVTILSFVVLLTSAYFGVLRPANEIAAGPSVPLAAVGWLGLLTGVSLLAVGVLRLVQHSDRRAGVRYPPAFGTEPAAQDTEEPARD